MGRRRKGIPGLSFSWKRATGLSAAKAKLSRQNWPPAHPIGPPAQGGEVLGGCVPFAFLLVGLGALVLGLVHVVSDLIA